MTSQASSSLVTRSRPAVLLATGIAAALGTYIVYQSFRPASHPTTTDQTGLHRSNAVRRSERHTGPAISIVFVQPPHGGRPDCLCTYGSNTYTFNLSARSLDRNAIIAELRLAPEEANAAIHHIEVQALEFIFYACAFNATSLDIFDNNVGEILMLRDLDAMADAAGMFTRGDWNFSLDAFNHAAFNWCNRRRRDGEGLGDAPTIPSTFAVGDGAETIASVPDQEEANGPGNSFRGMLYHIAEDEAQRQAHVHRGTRCDSCGNHPIIGIRWHCINCPDFDLCVSCEKRGEHIETHILAKIVVPVCTLSQPRQYMKPFYPGDHQRPARPLSGTQRRRIATTQGYEEAQVEALYAQFLSLSTSRYDTGQPQDGPLIDRTTFRKAFMSDSTPNPLEPSYLYDRMFEFYDNKQDNRIDFEEFTSGLWYLTHPTKRSSNRIFQGYDDNNDGFISRADMVRLLRAKYAIHQSMMMDIVHVEDEQHRFTPRDGSARVDLNDQMRSHQPISAFFPDDPDQPHGRGEIRQSFTKDQDQHGDLQTSSDPVFGRTVLPDGETDMDMTFWNSVLGRYAKKDDIEDLPAEFGNSLSARRRIRPGWTGAEVYEMQQGASGTRTNLARVDNRRARPYKFSDGDLKKEFQDDIAGLQHAQDDGNEGHAAEVNGSRGSANSQPTNEAANNQPSDGQAPFQKDRAMAVPDYELYLGEEVLYQVTEDAWNELLDPLFKKRERRAQAAERSQGDRQKYRKEIDDFVKERDNYAMEAQVAQQVNDGADDRVEPEPEAEKTNGHANKADELSRRQRSSSPSPEVAPDRITQPSTTQSANRPQLSQADVVSQIQTEAVPTDHDSLAAMEQNIRQQDLGTLLESSGFEVDNELQAVAIEDLQPISEEESRRVAEELTAALHQRVAQRNAVDRGPPALDSVEDADGYSSDDSEDSVDISQPVRLDGVEPVTDDGPTLLQLERWTKHDLTEKEIRERGGPARINQQEFDRMVYRPGRTMVKDLVESWLEWAGF